MSSDISLIKTVRMGVVGNGDSHAMFGPVLRQIPGLEVTALLERDYTCARSWARYLGKLPIYEELDHFLAEVPMDCVLIAAPESAPCALAAARAGKHILCENPIASNLQECDVILQTVAEQGVLFMPLFRKHFIPEFEEAAHQVAEGALGILSSVRCDWSFHPPSDQRATEERDWHFLFQEHASQTIDLSRWWLGEVETVSADVDMHSRSRQSADCAHVILNHARGVSVHHLARVWHHRTMERYLLQGAGGSLEIERTPVTRNEGTGRFRLAMQRNGGSPEVVTPKEPGCKEKESAHWVSRLALEEFIHCIRTGAEPRVTGRDARIAMEVISAAYLSSLEKAKVVLPLRDTSILARILPERIGQ